MEANLDDAKNSMAQPKKGCRSSSKELPLMPNRQDSRNKYAELPEKLVERPIAWNRVDGDLIGLLTIKTASGRIDFLALTMIDPSTGWFEVKDVKNKSVKESMNIFDGIWLSRYPRPVYICFDKVEENTEIYSKNNLITME
jgi:hypothetical protein